MAKQGTAGAGATAGPSRVNSWKSSTWDIGDAAVNKKHHNWHKIFGDKKPTLDQIKPYVKEALKKGKWKKTDVLRNNAGKIIGDKIELVHKINGHDIWIGGMRKITGEVIINNAAVK